MSKKTPRSKDKQYRKWSQLVKERDGSCVICGSNYRLAAHHINSWKFFPKQRYTLSNGASLCGGRGCHNAFHTMFKKSYQVKSTEADWFNFLDLIEYIKGLK